MPRISTDVSKAAGHRPRGQLGVPIVTGGAAEGANDFSTEGRAGTRRSAFTDSEHAPAPGRCFIARFK